MKFKNFNKIKIVLAVSLMTIDLVVDRAYWNIFQITAYTIIVAEDDTKNASGIEMPSWRDVQAYGLWPPYPVNFYH